MNLMVLGNLKFPETPLQHWHINYLILLFRRRSRLSTKGEFWSSNIGECFKNFFRYIDQYQGSLNWPNATVERGDRDVYQNSVMVASGAPVLEDDLFWVYTEYMQTGSQNASLLYGSWLNGSM